MKYLNGEFYVEVEDHRYRFHPTENTILRLRDEPKSLRTHYQVRNETQIRKNQKVNKNDNNELVVKKYPKNKQSITQQPTFTIPNCPSCKQNNWLEFDKGYYCKNCENIINKQKHQIDKKCLRQERDFSTRLNYANEKIREIWMNMVNTTYISTEDMINKLQQLKNETKIKFYKNKSNYDDNMNIRMHDDPFSKNSQGISKIYHEVIFLMTPIQTKPQVKSMNINYSDLYYTVIRSRDDKEVVKDKYEINYINFDDIVIPNQKPRETILK